MSQILTIEVAAGPICLLGERAAFLPDPQVLLVADAHLGKAQSFRRFGVPVPAGTTADNLSRMTALILRTQPRELVFLGDLLHGPHGRAPTTMASIARWRAEHGALPMRLVRGNHDSRAGDPPADWAIPVVDEPWRLGDWALCHHPQSVGGAYVLAGHLHPGVTIGTSLGRLRLPCFHVGPACTVLPAFGAFTGLHTVPGGREDRIIAVAEGDLRLLPG